MAQAQRAQVEVDDGEGGLSKEQHKVVQASREAMQRTIWSGAKREDRFPLLAVAVTGFFVDFAIASTAMPQLVASMNTQLAEAGLKIVPLQRN